MKLSFEPNLEFQRDAIKSVTDLFIGQSLDALSQAFQETVQQGAVVSFLNLP